MEALAPPLLEDPDSSIPSLFPYDSFPMPKGLYTQSNSSRSSAGDIISGGEFDGKWEEKIASTFNKGKGVKGGQRSVKGADELLGLAPALPISPPRSASSSSSPPRSASSSSSPRSSPTRSRRAKSTAELRQMAKNQRARNFTVDDDLSSQRASRSTLASFTSTGESVYEDAVEPDSDHVEELLTSVDQSRTLAPLDTSLLPDAPSKITSNENGSRSRQITPKPTHQSDYGYPTFASPTPLSPEVVASLDERILYEQRQVDLQAEAKRRMSFQQSISTLPTSPRAPPSSFRRHSGVPRNSAPPSHTRRASSIALATSPPIAGSRQWHPKPLVLTPARTMSTPLTSDSNLLSSPNRHLSTLEGSLDGHLRSHSRGSSYNDGTIRTASPLSPGDHSFVSRSASPCHSSPRRQPSIGGGNPRRRSLGYVGSPEPLSSFGRKSIQYDFRGRSASEDTRETRTTIESGITRFTAEGESPESSLGGWSEDMKMGQASPSLDDKEWEQQWQANRVNGTPLEMVEEVSSSDIRVINEELEVADLEDPIQDRPRRDSQLKSFRLSQQIQSNAPILRRRAATDDRSSLDSSSSRPDSFADTSLATLRPSSLVSGLRRGSVPPTPPPKLPLPRPPPSQSNKRSRSGYDQHWNGEPLSLERDSSSSTFGDEDSDYPASPKKPTFTQTNPLDHATSPQKPLTSSPRRPIVIKGATRQSVAASARRSERLSQADPPRYRSTSNSDRSSSYSSGANESRPSSRSSRRTSGLPSWEGGSYEPRNSEPLSTLPESDSPNPESYSQPFHSSHTRSQYRTERPASRTSYASSPRISIGSTFANGFGATRKVDFEPRDPRTLEELDAGQGSYLEVLLYSEPPPRAKPLDVRKSTATLSSYGSSSKRASLAPLVRSDSPTSPVLGSKPKSSSNFAQKLFSGFRGKPSVTQKAPSEGPKRPASIAASKSSHPTKTKPRPVVSGPLELQTAELAQKQLRDSAGVPQETVTPSLSVSFAPPIPIMKSYTSLARVYDQESDVQEFLSHSDSRTSLETIDRPPPRPFSLPPGLVNSKHDKAPPPPPPVKPPRSPLRPAMNSGNELLQPRADSPVLSFKSFNSHRSSIETSSRGRSSSMGRNSSSEPIGVRDVMRGQFLER